MTTRDWLRLIGIAILAVGAMCFPLEMGINPKRDLSLFNNFADTGAYWKIGVILTPIGLLILVLTHRER
jgi:hypothetical protein